MKRTTLALSDGDVAKLRDIAEQLGYLADSGPTAGSGSISKLIRAIADGEAAVLPAERMEALQGIARYHMGGDIRTLGGM